MYGTLRLPNKWWTNLALKKQERSGGRGSKGKEVDCNIIHSFIYTTTDHLFIDMLGTVLDCGDKQRERLWPFWSSPAITTDKEIGD